jgi:uncharacterized protein
MVTPAIEQFAKQIVEKFSPERVILFGSHARNEEHKDSDVDILVVMDHAKRNRDQALEILLTLDPRFPIDLLVRRPEDVERRLSMRDYFMRDIFREGRTLYDSRRS